MKQLFDFLKRNIHFVILIAYAFILYNCIDEKDTSIMLGFTVITAFILLQSRHIIEGQATPATAKVEINQTSGAIESSPAPVLTNVGAGYRTGTTVEIKPAQGETSGTGATATVKVKNDGTLYDFKIVNAGSGYKKKPIITFKNGPDPNANTGANTGAKTGANTGAKTGSSVGSTNVKEASANAVLENDTVKSINIVDKGSGYESPLRIEIIAGQGDNGTGASAVAKLDSAGSVTKIDVTNAGSGYKVQPTIRFVKAPHQEASIKIETVLKSAKYKEKKSDKQVITTKLDNLKAANEKDPLVVAPQQYLQKDTLIKVQKGIPRIGAYDGLCLSGLTTQTNYNLVGNDKINAYMGVQYPHEELATEDDTLDGPSIDGDDKSPHKLSMFANNMTSINCCGDSPYVSSSGCVCMTKKQKNFIQNRGLYATTNSFIDVEDDSDTTTDITVGSLPKPTKDEIILLNDNVNKQPTNKQKAFDYKDLLN
jgi:hypothetical protein